MAGKHQKKRFQEKADAQVDASAFSPPADTPRWAAPLGAAVLLVLLGGLAALALWLTGALQGKPTDEERAACQEILISAVRFDPAPFENLDQADNAYLLSAGIWQALSGEAPADAGMGELLLTGDQVRAACRRLFGPDCSPTLYTVMQQGVILEYDPAADVFYVPASAQLGLYEPRIAELTKKGGRLYAQVDYLSLDAFVPEGEEKPAVKRMTYLLEQTQGQYYIAAIRVPET